MTTTAQLLANDPMFMETLIQIDDRNGKIISFKLNAAQEMIEKNYTNRELIVKAGQLGVTTFWLAKGFKKVITVPNTKAVLVAHEEFLTQRLLSRVQVMYDRLPIPKNIKPKMGHSSYYEKTFPELNSAFYIGTAGAKVFGRGETINHFHGSEVAFWPDPDKILVPTMQRVPLDGQMVLESTPNGEGNANEPNVFYRMVQESIDDESIWHLTALPWWIEPEYVIYAGDSNALVSDRGEIKLTVEERDLARKAKWNEDEVEARVRWRRRKIKEIGAMFWQEMLEDIASCFLTVREPFYDAEVTERMLKGCYDPVGHSIDGAKIWYYPEEDEDVHAVYSITVDPGQGKHTRSVASVWRHDLEEFTVVRHEATLSGMYDPTAFAPMVKRLAEYYQYAKIIPEFNGHGQSFCAQVAQYRNLYYRTDVVSGIQKKEIGWKTTGIPKIGGGGTKIYALTELQSMLPNLETHDMDLVRELRQVKYAGDTVVFLGADDFHDTAMIMAATRSTLFVNPNRGFIGTSGWKW